MIQHESGYVSRRPWLIKPPKVRLALIHITYRFTDGEGDVVTCHTWAIGVSAKSAMTRWRNARPDIPESDSEYTVATEPKPRFRDLAQGKREEVEDPLLAACGV